ncbi:MAG TPA: translesion DNA synthesis-associated protein ImuA [Povalibacter sp.]|uniref:translesion DNA synthesis-associated protein ImuA n=1 Tax=Povalibacter sp. TaxID=1962978 RepID=UPI002C5A3E53|nr:translesion DNA synthesis-associated protein ImuA [Povalibacter sp.]HMN43595.1 translesion DNA synthesis-associated protein ImuA [Povalibacter sp.]
MDRAATLERLTRLCNLNREGVAPPAIEATGFAELDAALPHGGWQSGTLVELMPAQTGIGELSLLMPALARITQGERRVAMISPPYIPFAPALNNHGVRLEHLLIIRAEKNVDVLWAIEQTLRCQSFGAVLGWPEAIRDRDVRRLQLAAEAGRSTGFLYRAPQAAREASPAAIRLRLQASGPGLSIEILKCRGGRTGHSVAVNVTSRQITARSCQRPAASSQ